MKKRALFVLALCNLSLSVSAHAADPAGSETGGASDDPSAAPVLSPHPTRAIDPTVAATPAAGTGAGSDPTESEQAASYSFAHPYAWPQRIERAAIDGYILPEFQIADVPSALPRDQTQYGAGGTSAGFALHGTPFEGWSYMLHALVLPAGTQPLALLSPLAPTSQLSAISIYAGVYLDIEEASLTYRPKEWYLVKTGVLRIPFSVAQIMPVPMQMFPSRAAQSQPFQSGADVGLLNTFLFLDDRVQANAGVFLGSSLGLYNPNETVRGATLAASVEVHPLGAMPLREGDEERGPFRFALGFAGIYRAATAYDQTGYEGSHFDDTRIAASARASFKGLYLQGEYLHHVQTNDISGRPIVDDGGYGEASFYFPFDDVVAISPVLRAGVVSTGEEFASSKYTSYEAGMAFYPHPQLAEPERLKFLVEYMTATVSPLTEVEHVGIAQMQLQW